MKAKRYTEQIIRVLREAEAGAKTKDLCRKYGISEPTFYIYGLLPFASDFSRWRPGRMRTSIRRQPQLRSRPDG
jgi:putative transposase